MAGSLTVLLLAAVLAAPWAEPAKSEDSAWITLFNGKDLSGWRVHGEEKWVVEDGALVGESAAGKYGYLSTEKTYRDFSLRLKFKPESTGNSGLFFHSTLEGVNIRGLQVEVDPAPGKHTGGLYESGGRGWLVWPAEEAEKALRPGEWNDLELEVRGRRIRTRLNGIPAVDFTDPSPKFTDGVIALQIHTGGGVRVRWKDIRVKGEE